MTSVEFKEILASELFSLTGGVFAGFLLTFAIGKIELVPGLLILFPGFMEMRGNISGSLSARITSGLFVGATKYGHTWDKIVRGNIVASMIQVLAVSLFLGFLAFAVGNMFFGVTNTNIILVALIAGLLSNAIEVPLTVFTTLWLFRHGHDPNNIMGPYVTTIGDVISILSLLIAIWVVAV